MIFLMWFLMTKVFLKKAVSDAVISHWKSAGMNRDRRFSWILLKKSYKTLSMYSANSTCSVVLSRLVHSSNP